MKIGINAYPLSREFSGPSVCLFNIIKYLEIFDKENEFYLYSRSGIRLPFKQNSKWHIVITKGLLNKSSTYWTLISSKRQLLKDRIDLFWATENLLPPAVPKGVKKILTVYDLVWRCHRRVLGPDNLFILPLFANRLIKDADYIITISHSIADEIKKEFNIDSDKLSIIHLGVSDEFQCLDKNDSAEFIAKKYNVSKKYILFLGNIEPKKNIVNLLNAFKIFREKFSSGHQLLLAGGKRYNDLGIYRTYKKLRFSSDDVRFLGYVNFKDLPRLYAGARLFILPSIYEGFGLPCLEAMACGTPVVASDIPVFREILGDAALLVDPYNPWDIAGVIYRVLTDKALVEELRLKGFERIKLYSWERAAKETLKIIEEVGNKG